MPDWADSKPASALREVAAGQFYAGDSDPRKEGANWLRAVMGLKGTEPTGPLPFDALRSSESVDVVGEDSGLFPYGMDRIYLGTPQTPPSGTHLPAPTAPAIGPSVQGMWDRVMAQYPYASRFVRSVRHGDVGADARATYGNGQITLAPDAEDSDLVHELTHAAADQQFDTDAGNLRHYVAGGGPFNYSDRRGERVARVTQAAFENRSRRGQ